MRATLSVWILGAWLGGTLFMWTVATQNFRVVDRLLSAPAAGFRERIQGETRLVMRHQASELNRLYFQYWGWAQLALGLALAALIFPTPAGRLVKLAAAAMLVIVAVLQFYVVPETIRLGRLLDFAARTPPPPEEAPFWRLHSVYTILDSLKLVAGLVASWRFLSSRG